MNRSYDFYSGLKNKTIEVDFYCSRESTHVLKFLFLFNNNSVTKIGQYPSSADLASYDIQKYSRLLGKERYREFSKAVGLNSHGVGIGSFVYLRRIFEHLVEESHLEQKTSIGWNETQYKDSRLGKKISMLKDALPSFLVDNISIYSILSKGIHELIEEECLKAFPLMKSSIELILDEKIMIAERAAKIQTAKSAISGLTQQLKNKHQ